MESESDGHTFTHTLQPMQSSGEMASVYCRPAAALPFAGTSVVAAGAAAASASVRAKGRMVACGQTNAHWLHWMQVAASQAGTLTATPRFSYAAAPCSNWPSTCGMNADTGRRSPSMRPTGSMISRTIFTTSARPSSAGASPSSTASAQLAGTSTCTNAVAPASMARWFISTTSWPFFI